MNTKHLLHLVTFVLTFAVSVTVAGAVKSFVGLSTAEKITQVLTEDISNGNTRRENYREFEVNLAVSTDGYVSASENINTSDLPQDFQIAWQKHMKAWRTHSDYLNEIRYSSSFDGDYNQISRDQVNEINRTWYVVLRIARNHGAIIPHNAYK